MTYKATATLPFPNTDMAVSGLRGRLRMMAAENGAVPDWSTLLVTGPTERAGLHGVVWYEWRATVDAQHEPARYLP